MDCRHARLLLEFARPRTNELPHPDVAELRLHLDTCSECSTLADVERRADDRLGEAMRNVPIPTGLKNRLFARLKNEHKRRRWLTRTTAPLALAATLLLVLGLWSVLFFARKTDISIPALHHGIAYRYANPNPEMVEDWFASTHAIHLTAPRSFGVQSLNYALLTDYDLVVLPGGKQVPKLTFVRDKHKLVVYVLSNRQFNVLAGIPEESLGWTADVWNDPDELIFTYAIFYTGRLELFCQRAG